MQTGDEILIQGPTTGTIQMQVPEIRVDLKPVNKIEKGAVFSMAVGEKSGGG